MRAIVDEQPLRVAWPNKDNAVLYRPALPERYRQITAPLGIVGAIEVECSTWLEDNQWVLDVAARDTILVGTVGNLEPGQPEFRTHLDRFHRNPLLLGIRHGNLWGRNLGAELSQPEFLSGLKALAAEKYFWKNSLAAYRWRKRDPAQPQLGAARLPAGATASFTPPSVAVVAGQTAAATATVSVGAASSPGSYTFAFTADSAQLHRDKLATLNVPAAGSFSLFATPDSQLVAPGGSAAFTLRVTSLDGFGGSVLLSVVGLPAGVTSNLSSPLPVTLASGQTATVTAMLAASMSTLAGSYPLTFSADSGSLHREAYTSLGVSGDTGFTLSADPRARQVTVGGSSSYTLRITSLGSYAGLVQLGVNGLPAGVTAAFAPANPVFVAPGQPAVVTATVIASNGASPATTTLTFTADAGSLHREVTAELAVTAAGGIRLGSDLTRTATAGSTVSYPHTISSVGGFAGSVLLNVNRLPASIAPSFAPANPVQVEAGGTATFTLLLAIGADTAPGQYPFTVTADSGSVHVEENGLLIVTAAPSFTLSAAGPSNVARGQSAVFMLTLSAIADFAGDVSLSAHGLPPGAAVFIPASVVTLAASQTPAVTLSVTPGDSASLGDYSIQFQADSGGIRREAHSVLTVTGNPNLNSPSLALAVSPAWTSAPRNGRATYVLTLTPVNGFSGLATVGVSGQPSGTSGFDPSSSVLLQAGQPASVTAWVTPSPDAPLQGYTLTFTADAGALHQEASATLDVVTSPRISDDGIVNAASLRSGAVAPGELVFIQGGGFVPTDLSVLFDGLAAQVTGADANRIAVVVPDSVAGLASTVVKVVTGGQESNSVTLPVSDSAPGVFLSERIPGGQGLVLNQDGTANSTANPAPLGSTVTIIATGVGPIQNNRTVLPMTVNVGGMAAEVAGVAPGARTGTVAIQARVPAVPAPASQPLLLTVGSASSQTGVAIAVI